MLCKSNVNQEIFDVITFAAFDVKSVFVPDYIKCLGIGAFSDCYNFTKIEFSEESKLLSIGNFCFSRTSIRSISVPKNVSRIGQNTFTFCYNLHSIEFLNDNFSFKKIIFHRCTQLDIISLPNSKTIHHSDRIYSNFFQNPNFLFFVQANAFLD